MALDTKHPAYDDRLEDWVTLRDAVRGERQIKSKGTLYLPATSGMRQDGMKAGQEGKEQYDDYLCRARYPELNKSAVKGMIGIMHREEPTIELPAKLEPMMEKATVNGEPLTTLLRKINEQQLEVGRFGLLVDVPDGADRARSVPYIATYGAEAIWNWDDGEPQEGGQALELVVLDESGYERQANFEWKWVRKYRVLAMSNVVASLGDTPDGLAAGTFNSAVVREQTTVSAQDFKMLSVGGRTLKRIPFVFVNPSDLLPQPDDPPLLPLATLALAIYRGEADYRQTLFMQGQSTFVVAGAQANKLEDEGQRFGAGAYLELPMGATAEYVGVTADGLSEQREALQNDKDEAAQLGAHLLDNIGNQAESGEALRIRVAAKTASMVDVVRTGAEALRQALVHAAEWVGANPEEVVVKPNLDFADDPMTGKELTEYMAAKSIGAPISLRTIHRKMQDREVTELEFEEEMAEIEAEEALPIGREDPDDDGEVDDQPQPNDPDDDEDPEDED